MMEERCAGTNPRPRCGGAFAASAAPAFFWEPVGQSGTGILAGSLDQPTRLRTIGHIFVGEKCGFTEIAGDAPQFDGSSDGMIKGDEL